MKNFPMIDSHAFALIAMEAGEINKTKQPKKIKTLLCLIEELSKNHNEAVGEWLKENCK